MTSEKKDEIHKRNKELVNQIYAGALNPSTFNELFKAWDEHFDALTETDQRTLTEDFSWTEEFVSHFEQAGLFLDKISYEREPSLFEKIETIQAAVILCRPDGIIYQTNEHAAAINSISSANSILELAFDMETERIISGLLKFLRNVEDQPEDKKSVVRLSSGMSDEPLLFWAEYVVREDGYKATSNSRYLMFKAISPVWSEGIAEAVAAAFKLTEAEVDLVQNLYHGLSIREISESTKRSQATLRTQLSSVLHKTGTKTQVELARILSGLVQIFAQQSRKDPKRPQEVQILRHRKQTSRSIKMHDGSNLQVVESGDLDGVPFFFIQLSTTPTLTDEIIEALHGNGIRLISPYRSGVGGTTKQKVTLNPEVWVQYYLQAMEHLGVDPNYIGGHCSGGIYALHLAKELGKRCKRILLVDTGAPLKTAWMVNQMPSAPKRQFLAARYFPAALKTPYRLVKADFYSGSEGEDRLVRYFYDGSPTDEQLLDTKDYWQITRDNLDYCMQNPFQLARDVAHWSRDHTPLLEAVSQNTHVRYFHGEDNYVHRADNIRKLCSKDARLSNNIVPGQAQLLIYAEPELFAGEIARLCDIVN